MTTLPYDVQRCTGRIEPEHWCKQRSSCQRYLAFTQWDKEVEIPEYIWISVSTAVPNCQHKIEAIHD